ncbi:MAG: hypothetical protein ACKVOH_00435 [Chlamydiales bacterium]
MSLIPPSPESRRELSHFPSDRLAAQGLSFPLLSMLQRKDVSLLESIGGFFVTDSRLISDYSMHLTLAIAADSLHSCIPADRQFCNKDVIWQTLPAILGRCSLSTLKNIETMIHMEGGAAFLHTLTLAKCTPSQVAMFSRILNTLCAQVKKDPEKVAQALLLTQELQYQMGGRIAVEDQLIIVQALCCGGSEQMQKFLGCINELQSLRPETFFYGDEKTLPAIEAFEALHKAFEGTPLVQDVAQLILDATCLMNTQSLQYCVGCHVTAPTDHPRLAPLLKPRKESPMALCEEFRPSFTIWRDSKNIIDMGKQQGHVELIVTNPHTWECRSLLVPLPLKGVMTEEEVRAQLLALEESMKDPENFDTICLKYGVDPDEVREDFTAFSHTLESAYARAVASLNGAKTSLEREEPLTVAAQGNIYRTEGGELSLLPAGYVGETRGKLPERKLFTNQLGLREVFHPVSTAAGEVHCTIGTSRMGGKDCVRVLLTLGETTRVAHIPRGSESLFELLGHGRLEREILLLQAQHWRES